MISDEIFLREAEPFDEEDVMKFKTEYQEDVKLNGTEISGEAALVRDDMNFEEWLERQKLYSKRETLKPGYVLGTHFLTIRKSDNKVVGMVNVRWELNEQLLFHGGHIGDCVRPSERNKGYGTKQIALALEMFKQKGEKRVLITCKDYNIASAKTIEKNGGVLENQVEADGFVFNRYWINFK